MNPAPSRPLLITADEVLLDDLVRLAAAAGVTPDLAHEPSAALRGWSTASMVLLGADLVEEMARLVPARRAGVYVVAWGGVGDDLFRLALAVGAETVVELPRSDAWVVGLLTDLGDHGQSRGVTVGVTGGSGGAGATTFACALGQLSARVGPAVVVDADPLGPGVDRVLGLDEREGVRWGALAQTTGRLSGRSLREALPRRGNLGALTWELGSPSLLDGAVVRQVLSAAGRGHDTVVVDLPRTLDPVVDDIVSRCDLLLVVVVPTVTGTASAARLVARLPDQGSVRLVIRGPGADPREVSRVVGVPAISVMAEQRGLAESIDLGLGPVRSPRGSLGRAVSAVLDRVSVMVPAA